MDDERRLCQREAELTCSQRDVAEAAPVIHDHNIGRPVAKGTEDFERGRKIGRPDALQAGKDAQGDPGGRVDARPFGAQTVDVASTRDEQFNVVAVPPEGDSEE